MPAGAAAAARRLVAEGAEFLLSFGLAGALDPKLRPGDLAVPRAVLSDGELFLARDTIATIDVLLGGDRVLASVSAKQAAWRRTGAAAVDLESGAVARVAREAGIEFGVLRAICDPAERSLPPAALIALDQLGRIGVLQVIGSVLRKPGQLRDLLSLARDAQKARAALHETTAPLDPAMGPGVP